MTQKTLKGANNMEQYYRMKELSKMLKLTPAGIYYLIGEGQFPKGIKLGAKARGWSESEIKAWLESRKGTIA